MFFVQRCTSIEYILMFPFEWKEGSEKSNTHPMFP